MIRAVFAAALLLTAVPVAAQAPASSYAPESFEGVAHPAWSRKAIIYQVNTRQFTKDGTLKAATREIPRLKKMGVDILWLMPIHPIGVENRKGTLGSPYSVRDYRAVNPELGTMADLKAFTAAAHAQGMHVVLDWVANHSAWDNPLKKQHPDWYETDWKGANRSTPWWDWSDIVDFDYSKEPLRRYMATSMAFWVREAGVDGFRADVAGYVPPDFWTDVRRDLNAIKPVWMLGEFNHRDLHMTSFDSSYGWAWAEAVMKIAKGEADTGALYGYYSENESAWPTGAQRMIFTSNHDENAWAGTEFERFGKALPNAFALLFTSEGIPLVYNGQEAGNDKRLKFFERDPIVWKVHPNGALIRDWIAFRKAHPALDNAPWGARMVHVKSTDSQRVFSFVRAKDGDAVFVAQNYSDQPKTVTLEEVPHPGQWTEKGGGVARIEKGASVTLAPWSTRVFTRRY
ncbi:alpha-amylase family glycosyl hydrolase [Sphingomonas sp. LY160]|uniref:alpha-amylase family glycosyl hydrolase n=1 Tax=Sphingomonas sp. LY160 TaxID=3095342 RepID=UPI002ADEA67C|nr:alpha-amylase family glycosyl hydrolase [Sphingomonas sp. LY160]MEA1072902.1 alpha-amylase family glycosyl hydrolase [Sphingomonas sp. LY160]